MLAIPMLFLVGLGLRLVWLFGKRARKGSRTPTKGRNLLLETLHEQALREREALEKSKEKGAAYENLDLLHRTIMAHLPVGVLVLGPDGRIQFANPGAVALLPRRDVQDQPLQSISKSLYREFSRMKLETSAATRHFSLEVEGRVRRLALSLLVLPENHFLFTLTDKTREHRLEEALRYKRELALMGELAGGITHEVKNALAVMQGHVQMAVHGDVTTHARRIQEEIDHLLNMVRAFMKSSKDNQTEFKKILLRDWLESLAMKWRDHPDGAMIAFQLPKSDWSITGDPVLLEMVLRNLILNGLDACRSENPAKPWVTVAIEHDAERTTIIVEDRGPGFPPQIRQKMFIPFISSKEKGSGLGLFHCRKIMMEHRGELEVPPDQPTRVKCHFPHDG